jgi:transcriptional regulator with XRE-family HTH domain
MSVSGTGVEPAAREVVPLARRELDLDSRPEAASRLLGEELRRLRKERGFGLKDVAPVIRGSVSKVSRLERGESPPKRRDIEDLARFYRVTPQKWRELDALLDQSRSSAWWDQYADVTTSWLRRLIGLEAIADVITTYETHVVPGLLQTPSYTRAVVTSGLPSAHDEEVERRCEVRKRRQQVLRDAQRPKIHAFLDEGVLHRAKGGPGVMAEQLQYLRQLDEMPGITVRILTFDAPIVPDYPITHMHFRDGGPAELVYVEHIDSAHYVTKPAAVDRYRLLLNEVRRQCSSREESIRHLEKWICHYEEKLRGEQG